MNKEIEKDLADFQKEINNIIDAHKRRMTTLFLWQKRAAIASFVITAIVIIFNVWMHYAK